MQKGDPARGAVLSAEEAPQKSPSETLVEATVRTVFCLQDLVRGRRERSFAQLLASDRTAGSFFASDLSQAPGRLRKL